MFAADSEATFESTEGQHPNFFVGGTIERKLGEERHPNSGHRQFQFVDAVKVRKGRGDKETGARTLPAYEITLKVLGDDVDTFMKEVQAGQVFAFEPRNHRKEVASLKKLLGNPKGFERILVKNAYLASEGEQDVSVDDALSGVMDLSAPSLALVKLLDARVKAVGGTFLGRHDPEAVIRSYTVNEVIAHAQECYHAAIAQLPFPEEKKAQLPRYVMNVQDLARNQPPMYARPYTLSDFNRKTGEVKIVMGDVAATLSGENPFGLTDKDGKPLGERVKRDGNATAMMRWMRLHNAKKGPFMLGGSVDVEHPKLAFAGLTEYTESIQHARTMTTEIEGEKRRLVDIPEYRTAQVDMVVNPNSPYKTDTPVETIYLVATGTGIAPYLALLRDLKRKKDNGESIPEYNIVLTMGGRFQQDKIAHEELCQYVDEGLLEAYHFVSSSDQREYQKTRNGEGIVRHKDRVQPSGWQGSEVKYAQHVLKYYYADRIRDELMRNASYVYLCGTKRAEHELVQICPEKLVSGADAKQPDKLFGTASVPSRFRDTFNASNKVPAPESLEAVKALRHQVNTLEQERSWQDRAQAPLPTRKEQGWRAGLGGGSQ